MLEFLKIIFSLEFLGAVLRVSTPIVFATMAALISNRAGVQNIGIEGLMLIASLVGVVASAFTESAWLGLLFAVVSSVLLSWLFSVFVLKFKTNIVLAGIAINLLASGLTVFILYILTGDKGVSSGLASKTLPVIPFFNIPVLSGQNVLTWMAFISVPLVSTFLYKTKIGTYIRAVGEHGDAIATAGVSVYKTQRTALLLCGVFSGLGGAYMSMGYLSMFTKDMIAGRGFIAIAADAMGMGKPVLSTLIALLFGATDALSNQLGSFNIPNELVSLIPYVVTITALAMYAANNKKKQNQ